MKAIFRRLYKTFNIRLYSGFYARQRRPYDYTLRLKKHPRHLWL